MKLARLFDKSLPPPDPTCKSYDDAGLVLLFRNLGDYMKGVEGFQAGPEFTFNDEELDEPNSHA